MDDDDDHHHLLSIFITLFILTLIYLPSPLLLLILAAVPLLLTVFRNSKTSDQGPQVESLINELKLEDGLVSKSNLDHKFDDPFVEWDVRAPLEVIYEEESENEDQENKDTTTRTCLSRYSSLSKYFPESDSDTTSSDEYPDWNDDASSPGKIGFKWDEDDANGLIEIELDYKKGPDFELEDNMFEIDISPASSSQIPAS